MSAEWQVYVGVLIGALVVLLAQWAGTCFALRCMRQDREE
jgi:hypothetical protein